jgi:hypothetical protein
MSCLEATIWAYRRSSDLLDTAAEPLEPAGPAVRQIYLGGPTQPGVCVCVRGGRGV